MIKTYLGIDVGSISTKGVLITENREIIAHAYLRTQGQPIEAIKNLIKELFKDNKNIEIKGVGTTGSARRLAGVIVGADVIKNEIITHAVAATYFYPETRTIIEIGGQDSKIILLKDSVPVDFAMNTVCAAGTGSFLEHQAIRLGIPIEEFGDYALRAKKAATIAGRCTVFAESDMIHKTQLGIPIEEIIRGLCEAIVRNYLGTVAKGKDIQPLILFQGGVAANIGVKTAFERALGIEVIVPQHFLIMGAIGAAFIAQDYTQKTKSTKFIGENLLDINFKTKTFECRDCTNFCEVIETYKNTQIIDRYGDRCGKWSEKLPNII
ncbi:MAG: acyl-CoA dehydratase activase [candidate division WOR-3 bacterium]|nr:acyl-CoA dehydratase activase [candidate division WOR-3 bacterium]MCX7757360.1 acyl-CoA dehydratase activase [candidate division WOR-3 bacterium]MDW7987486.1 acyl-CoA dehydratase activase [candidate division WOR-3 bacterium]